MNMNIFNADTESNRSPVSMETYRIRRCQKLRVRLSVSYAVAVEPCPVQVGDCYAELCDSKRRSTESLTWQGRQDREVRNNCGSHPSEG